MTGNALVDAISEIAFEGNITPWSWYQALRFPNGKPDLNAIVILSEIVYWYRGAAERDEATGTLLGWRQRFKADLLQRSYQALAEQFGLTKRQAQDACTRLAKVYGVIRLVFRTIDTPTGRLANVLFIEPVPEKIRAITHQRDTSHVSTGHLPHSNGTPLTVKRETYTEISTESTTEKEEGERTRAQDVDVVVPAQEHPTRPTPAPSRRMPADYTPSAELRAELEGRYPMLDFEEELYAMRNCEFPTPKRDWDATTRMWFSREAKRRPVATGPSQGTHGDWRNTGTTDKRTRELERQRQVALANFHTAQEQQQAITVVYEDITHGDERLPGVSGLVDRPGGMLLHHAPPGQSRPAVLCRPHTL
jgi:hypothetical protein